MNTITKVINQFIKDLNNEDEDLIECYIEQPFNIKKALEEDIAKTEAKLSCQIPTELRNYYLNEINGIAINEEEYANCSIYENSLDIFSHQKIMGIYDFFKLYWGDNKLEDIFDIDEELLSFMEKYNKEYFVCIVNWAENFLETFAFDKEGNYFRFNYDQDEVIDVYIKEMLNGSEHMQKDKSLIKLLKDYLEEVKEDLD